MIGTMAMPANWGYKDVFAKYVSKIWVNAIVLVLGLAAFVYTRVDSHYILIPQLIAYVCISICIAIILYLLL